MIMIVHDWEDVKEDTLLPNAFFLTDGFSFSSSKLTLNDPTFYCMSKHFVTNMHMQ